MATPSLVAKSICATLHQEIPNRRHVSRAEARHVSAFVGCRPPPTSRATMLCKYTLWELTLAAWIEREHGLRPVGRCKLFGALGVECKATSHQPRTARHRPPPSACTAGTLPVAPARDRCK